MVKVGVFYIYKKKPFSIELSKFHEILNCSSSLAKSNLDLKMNLSFW